MILKCRRAFDLNYEIGLNLYVAISSDTGSFKYENTTPQTMRIAGELLEKGINPAVVSQKLFDEYPLSTIFLLRDSLAGLELNHTREIAWMSVNEEMLKKYGAEPSEMDGFVNYLKNISEVEVGVLFYHTAESSKIGFRSKTIDVALMPKLLAAEVSPSCIYAVSVRRGSRKRSLML